MHTPIAQEDTQGSCTKPECHYNSKELWVSECARFLHVSSCTCVVESVPFQETTENISPRPCSASCSFVLFTSWNEPTSPSESWGSGRTTSTIFHGFFILLFSITKYIYHHKGVYMKGVYMNVSNSLPSPRIVDILEW